MMAERFGTLKGENRCREKSPGGGFFILILPEATF